MAVFHIWTIPLLWKSTITSSSWNKTGSYVTPRCSTSFCHFAGRVPFHLWAVSPHATSIFGVVHLINVLCMTAHIPTAQQSGALQESATSRRWTLQKKCYTKQRFAPCADIYVSIDYSALSTIWPTFLSTLISTQDIYFAVRLPHHCNHCTVEPPGCTYCSAVYPTALLNHFYYWTVEPSALLYGQIVSKRERASRNLYTSHLDPTQASKEVGQGQTAYRYSPCYCRE